MDDRGIPARDAQEEARLRAELAEHRALVMRVLVEATEMKADPMSSSARKAATDRVTFLVDELHSLPLGPKIGTFAVASIAADVIGVLARRLDLDPVELMQGIERRAEAMPQSVDGDVGERRA